MLEKVMPKSMKKRSTNRAKREPKVNKNLQKTRSEKWLIFGSIFPNFPVFLGSHFHPNLPSVRKVTCRKTNKKGKESKKKERLQCRTRQSALENLTRPAGPRSRPGADLSCLRQYIRPGPAEKGFCENLRLVGRMRQFPIFCSLDGQKYQK